MIADALLTLAPSNFATAGKVFNVHFTFTPVDGYSETVDVEVETLYKGRVDGPATRRQELFDGQSGAEHDTVGDPVWPKDSNVSFSLRLWCLPTSSCSS